MYSLNDYSLTNHVSSENKVIRRYTHIILKRTDVMNMYTNLCKDLDAFVSKLQEIKSSLAKVTSALMSLRSPTA